MQDRVDDKLYLHNLNAASHKVYKSDQAHFWLRILIGILSYQCLFLLSIWPAWCGFENLIWIQVSLLSAYAPFFCATWSFPNSKGGWLGLNFLQENITSSVLSALKCIFHCHAHNFTVSKSSFSSKALLTGSYTQQNNDVSSANILISQFILSTRSLM